MATKKTTEVAPRTTSDALADLAEAFTAAAAACTELDSLLSLEKSDPEGEGLDEVTAAPSKSGGKAPAKKVAGGKKKAPVVTFEAVKEKLTELMNAKGKEIVKSILSEFGVAKLVDVGEDSYADLVAKIDESMAEEETVEEEEDLFGE